MSDIAPFLDAVKRGDVGQVERLLGQDRSLAKASDDQGVSMILVALYHHQVPVARALASRVPRLSLHEAAALGNLGQVKDILAVSQGSLHTFSPDGYTPLGFAAYFGHPEVVAVLLDAGADPDLPSKNSMQVTPLHSAVANEDGDMALKIAMLLLDKGANPNARQHGGWAPLHAAALHGRRALGEVLVAAGAEATPASDEGKTPIQLARESGHDGFAEWLKEQSA